MKSLRTTALTMCLLGLVATGMAQPTLAPTVPELIATSLRHERANRSKDALNTMFRALRTEPENYFVTVRTAWLCYGAGRYAESIALYKKAAGLNPKAVEPQLGLTLPLLAAGKWSEAATVTERIIAQAPGNYAANARLAYVLYYLGRYKQAAAQYRKTLELYPSDTQMTLGLAWSLLKTGDLQEAKALFGHVLSVRQADRSAQAGLRLCRR
jgi:tetratricopeptide (TPR) repeat protein